MSRRLILAVFLLAAPIFGQKASAAQRPTAAIFSQINEMTATLSQITGWPVKKQVPSEILTNEAFRRYVESHTADKSNQKEIRVAELALKMFGLVPQDFNLAKETVDLLGEQAAAFYDYKKKRLFILANTREGDDQRMALVHELAHALADQQHPLGKYLEKGSPTDDEATAREAVMEGQATWLTWAYESKRRGGAPELPKQLLDQLSRDSEPSPEFPVLASAPLYIRESLLFPYNEGARFQDAVYRRMGRQAFEAVFAKGPQSTQQVLHPEEYFSGAGKPTSPLPPQPKSLAGSNAGKFKLLVSGSFGEFDHEVLLRQYVGRDEASAMARHWRGGAFDLYEHRNEKYPVLSYASEWDTPEAAREYFDLYLQVLQRKWKKMQMTARTPSEVRGVGDSGRFVLWLSGSVVSCLEGLRAESNYASRVH